MMPVRFATILTAPALLVCSALAAGAATETATVYTAMSPVEMLEILGAEKGSIEIDTTQGDTTLEGRVNGTDYQVYFYECDGGALTDPAQPNSECLGYEFRAYYQGFPDDPEMINRWNGQHHYGAMWRDEDGDLALQLNTVVEGGITEQNVRITFQWWLAVMDSFDDFMGDQ